MGVSGCRVSQGSWVQLQTLPMSLGRDQQSRLWDETAARREEAVDKQLGTTGEKPLLPTPGEKPLLTTTGEKPMYGSEDPGQPKIN